MLTDDENENFQRPTSRPVAGKRPASYHRTQPTQLSSDLESDGDRSSVEPPGRTGSRSVSGKRLPSKRTTQDGESSGTDVQSEVEDSEEEDDDDEEAMLEMHTSGFIVDDDEEENEDRHHRRRHRHKRRQHRRRGSHIEEGADLSEAEGLGSNDNLPSEAEENMLSDDNRRRKKKRRKAYDPDDDLLDEEDLALVEENMGISLQRPAENRPRRLKRGRDQVKESRRVPTDRDDLSHMFDDEIHHREAAAEDYEDEELSYARRPDSRMGRARGYHEPVHDDLDDFIADEDEEDELGRGPIHEDEELAASDEEAHQRSRGGRPRDYRGREDMEAYSTQTRGGVPGMSQMFPDVPGLDADAWQDLYDVFGDGTDYDYAMRVEPERDVYQARAVSDEDEAESPELRLKDVFEPAELERKMMTDKDNEIRARDIPERFQVRFASLRSPPVDEDNSDDFPASACFSRPLTDTEVEEETEWAMQYFVTCPDPALLEEYTAAVYNVCRFIGRDFMEVPFISTHRRDYLMYSNKVTLPEPDPWDNASSGPLPDPRVILKDKDLWTLFDVDIKFRSFNERKWDVRNLIGKLRQHMASDLEGANPLDTERYPLEQVKQLLQRAHVVDEVHDLLDYVQLLYGPQLANLKRQASNNGDSESQTGTEMKRPSKNAIYEQCRKSTVSRFAAQVSVSPHQFAINFSDGEPRTLPQNPPESVQELAEKFIAPDFASVNLVIRSAQMMLAQEIGLHPRVRYRIRRLCRRMAVVSVEPTARGRSSIDNHHDYYPFKYLHRKPVEAFSESGQFLSILEGEKSGLLRVTIELDDDGRTLSSMEDSYTSDQFSEHAQNWDSFRREVIKLADQSYFKPLVNRYTREWLRSEAEEYVSQALQRTLEVKLNVKPCVPHRLAPDQSPRVLTLTMDDEAAANEARIKWVALDSRGQLVDQGSLAELRTVEGMDELVEILEKRKPDVVGVSGTTPQVKRLIDEVTAVAGDYQSRGNDEVATEWVDDEVARVYRNLPEAVEEFPNITSGHRYCVALGRHLQGPVYSYASLGNKISALRLHPQQALVSEEMAQRYVERAFVNVVNRMGVDINLALQFPHYACVLQYVAGLGPRKVSLVTQRLETTSEGFLDCRASLILNHITTRNIFMNCASFLRVVPPDYDILDNTRIHPEDYALARKMATDALEVEVEEEMDDDNPSLHVEELMRSDPEKLNELLLEDYAQELEKRLKQPKLEALRSIKQELQAPYADSRAEFEPLSEDRLFTMLTGETEHTLYPDQIVVTTVQRVRDRFAICKLDSGVDGFLPISRVDDERVEVLADILSEGEALPCAIIQVNKDRFTVDLTSRPSDLDEAQRRLQEYEPKVDTYFDHAAARAEARAKSQEARNSHSTSTGPSRSSRIIDHPLFKPFRSKEAEVYLADRQVGSAVIRPSSRGNDHIAVTWKVADGVYQHVDVVEEDKPSAMAVGHTLRVGRDNVYSDLDELIVMHIEAMGRLVEEMTDHPKYRDSSLQDMQEYISAASKTQQRGVYGFCLCPERPGWFYLVFKPNPKASPIIWKVQVCPNAYRLGEAAYPDVSALINGFKRMQMNRSAPPRGSTGHSSRSSGPAAPSSNYRSHQDYDGHHRSNYGSNSSNSRNSSNYNSSSHSRSYHRSEPDHRRSSQYQASIKAVPGSIMTIPASIMVAPASIMVVLAAMPSKAGTSHGNRKTLPPVDICW
ncbi:Transcription elongation factor spt6 [Dispira parvispora]|uniref:Transcription elongation factor Spt6 n=1 Tax=Dispira parvispora TaxID=1520584 RepID=A0A9W8EAE5_9FUNG|nr:Transcription elongation factor spt6 [Dispira parvispora]